MSEHKINEVKSIVKNELRNWKELQPRQVLGCLLLLAEAIEELQAKLKTQDTPPTT